MGAGRGEGQEEGTAGARDAEMRDAEAGAGENRAYRPAWIKAWANLYLKASPADLAASTAGRAALEDAARAAIAEAGARGAETTIAWWEGGVYEGGRMDAYASGRAGEMAPLLAALGERGFGYGVDVDVAREDDEGEERPDEEVEAEFERVVGACGRGVDYAEAYDVV